MVDRLTTVFETLRLQIQAAREDLIVRNSLYLMASTVAMAIFGFVFWLINTRLFTTEQVGLASSLIAITTTMSMFSQLGFDNALVRFLPSSKSKNRVIDTALIVAALSSFLITALFLMLLPVISPKIHAVILGPLGAAGFLAAMVLITNNTLTDSIFIAFQEAKYIFFIDIVLGLTRIALPIFFVSLGAYGLFAAHAGAVIIASLLSLVLIARRYHWRFQPVIDRPTIRQLSAYSTGTYLASLSEALPLMILPILVTNQLGAKPAAYFYSAMTVANLIFIIPRATANSLLADNSRREASSRRQLLDTFRHTGTILVPAVAAILAFGQILLLVFGPDYAEGGQTLLRLFAISALVLAFNVITAVRFKIAKNVRRLVVAQTIGAASMIALFFPFSQQFGLTGVGYAWLTGQLAITVALLVRRPQGRLAQLLGKLYYLVAYNIQLPINLTYAFGSLAPYLFLIGSHGLAGIRRLVIVGIITAVTTYTYTLTYIVNDWIDRHKDAQLKIPKFTAHHAVGWRPFLLTFATIYALCLAGLSEIQPMLGWWMLAYAALIILLAWTHSAWPQLKLGTVFIQRFLKFCAPWGMIYLALPHTLTGAFFIGSLFMYPLSFGMDYAYRGYIRDRLKRPIAWRFVIYAAYWLILLIMLEAFVQPSDPLALVTGIATYVIFSAGTALTANGLARLLRPQLAQPEMTDRQNYERSRLISFSLIQLIILTASFAIAALD